MVLLLFVAATAFLPALSLHESIANAEFTKAEERIAKLPPDDRLFFQLMKDDKVYWFAEICGNRAPNNSQGIKRSLEKHPENASIFETFAQNIVYIAETKERRDYIRRRMASFIDWLTDIGVRPYHDEVRVYVPRERDSSARHLREIYELINSAFIAGTTNNTMDLELASITTSYGGYLFALSASNNELGEGIALYNSIFAMIFRPYTQIEHLTDGVRDGAIEFLHQTINNILKDGHYRAEVHHKLLEALKHLNGTMPSPIHSSCSTSEHWVRLCVTWLMRGDDERDKTLKRMISERRQLETKVDRMQRELQSATDKKKSLEVRLRSVQEERDSLMAQLESAKEQAVLKERELSAKVERAMAVAAVHAQEKHQLQSDYAQALAEAQGREYELTENLREQCLISQSLSHDVEEMKHLILAMTEANDVIMATDQPENAPREGAWPCENDVPATSHDATRDVPLDPVAADPVAPSRDEFALDQFITDVYATLYSRPHGYDSIPWFLRDLRNDAGIDGERMARSCAYDTFEAFLQSAEMAPRVLVTSNAEGARLYKVYPAKVDLENYVAQQLGTDYGETKRSLAFHREENSRLRSQLAATLERMERLKTEALKPKSSFRAAGSVSRNMVAVPSDRFRKVNAGMANAANTSHSVLGDHSVQESDDSTATACIRTRMDNLERMVQCSICMDRPKDTAFACGHTYCEQCATDLRQCTFGCKKTNGKPLKFKYRIFL